MPKAWKQDFAQRWEKLEPDMADWLSELEDKREKDVLSGVEKYRTEAEKAKTLNQYAEGLKEVLTPYEQTLVTQYGSVQNGLKTLFNLSGFAARDPMGFIQYIAQSRGLNLSGLAQANPQMQHVPQGLPDPTQQLLQSALQPWVQKVTGLEQQVQQFTQAQSRALEAQSLKAVNDFLAEKDGENLKFALDEGEMEDFGKRIAFIRGNHADWDDRRVLESAHAEVSRLRPDYIEKEFEKREKERKAREQAELQAKKQAAVSVKGAPSTSPASQVNPADRRAVIERAMSDLQR